MAGLAQINHGLSRASGQADISGIEALGKSDNAPVTNLMQQQASGMQAMQQQKVLDANDKNSDDSVAFRKSLKLIAPKIADVYGDDFDRIQQLQLQLKRTSS